MSARRKIDMVGAENFTISETNPNAGMGLPGCACGSWRCPGPFIVFPTYINQGGRRGAFVSVSLACAKRAVVNYEKGAEVSTVGNGRPGEDGPPAEIDHTDNPYFQTGPGSGQGAVSVDKLLDSLKARDKEQLAAEHAAGVASDDGMPEKSEA